MKMPITTQRAHFEPAWKGDRFIGLKIVSKSQLGPDGIRAIDNNIQWFWRKRKKGSPRSGEAFALHWRNPARNNFPYIVDEQTGRVRPMTPAELRRTDWQPSEVHRWRRGKSKHSAKPRTYKAMARRAAKLGVVICGELKTPAFRRKIPAQHVVNAAISVGHPPWFMALFRSMPYCRGKCKAIIRAGGQFAVIFGRYQHYRSKFHKAVKRWPVQPTRVW